MTALRNYLASLRASMETTEAPRSDTLRERMQAEHVEKRAESGTWFVVIVILCLLAAMLVPHWGV